MENIKTWGIMRSFRLSLRYVVVESETGYYLIDTDRYTFWLGYIFPLFNWIIPHTVMKLNLSHETVNDLLISKNKQQKRRKENSSAIWIGIGLVAIIGPFLNYVASRLEYYNLSIIYILVGMLLISIIKICVSKSNREIRKLIGKNLSYEGMVLMLPQTIRQALKLIILFLILLSFWMLSFVASVDMNNWILFLVGLVMFNLFLFINCSLAQIGEYKIKFLKGK